MKKLPLIVTPIILVIVLALTTCRSSDNICEDITVAKEQQKQCQILQRKIKQAQGHAILRTELERRYQKDCLDVRYYRDIQQTAICGNKHKQQQVDDAEENQAQ